MLFFIPSEEATSSFEEQTEKEVDYFIFSSPKKKLDHYVVLKESMGLKEFIFMIRASLEKKRKVFLIGRVDSMDQGLIRKCQPYHYFDGGNYLYLAPSIRKKVLLSSKLETNISFENIKKIILGLLKSKD